MRRRLSALLAPLLLAAPVFGQPAYGPSVDTPDRPLVVMNLAAHPDDEDGLTMAYYRGNQDAVVYSVVFTRGEGGQNEAGPELYERLGAIRTGETEAAARVLGTQVLWLNLFDFGFSKHAAEAFAEWSRPRRAFWDLDAPAPGSAADGEEAVTAALVRLVRRLKPDVMFTNHDTLTAWPNAQHGHHQVVGLTAARAFDLAADPAYRPEQLREPGVGLWQPARLFVRTGGFSGGPGAYDVAVPVGDACAPTVRRPGEACADRAVAAAALHVSQGFDGFASRFRRDTTYFVLYRQSDAAAPLPGGATDLAAGLAPREATPPMTVEYLVDAGRIPPLDGLATGRATVLPGETVRVTWPVGAEPGQVLLPTVRGLGGAQLVEGIERSAGGATIRVGRDRPTTLPAFRQQYERAASSPPLVYTVVQPSTGLVAAGYLPVEIAPPASVELAPAPIHLRPGRNEIEVEVDVHSPLADSVDVALAVIGGGRALVSLVEPVGARERTHTIAFDLPADLVAGDYTVQVETNVPGCGLPWYRATRPAVVLPDVAVAPGLRVGFVRSYDGTTADALRQMGADVVDLDSTALAAGAFGGLHTVVVDIRAYLDRPDLRAHNDRLLDWVRRGGHLVVGYQKSFEWNEGGTNPADRTPNGAYAPYPLQLGRDRVTVEAAPVALADPDALVFHRPYAIGPDDWDGWVQERGLYFPTEDTDARYRRLLTTADPGEAPLTTALLLADVGRGTYVYTPLGLYRQLAALVPGAWRLTANLVSLPLLDARDGPAGTR